MSVLVLVLVGAASALLLTYATYMRREDGVVTMGTLTPLANNFVRYALQSVCCLRHSN